MKTVFISHTRSQSVKARLLADVLQKENVSVFKAAESLATGAEWHAELLAQIKRCSLFVALVDDLGQNVMFELGYALGAAKQVLLMADPDTPIPLDIASLPVARFDNYELSAVYDVAEKLLSKLGDTERSAVDLIDGKQPLRHLANNPDYVEQLSPREFEAFVVKLFNELGFETNQTLAQSDAGYDLVLWDKDKQTKTIVEIKKYARNSKLGVASVHQLLGNMMLSDASSALLVTSGGFSASAVDMAQKSHRSIKLLTLEELISMSRSQLQSSLATPDA